MNKKLWQESRCQAADINEKIILHLRDLSHIMRCLYEGRGSQKRVLMVLYDLGGSTTQRELTECLGIRPGSASEVFAKLEHAGHIQRTVNAQDRRTAVVALTDTGKLLAEEAKRQRNLRHETMFSCLSDSEKEELLALLEKVGSDWEYRYRDMRK